MLERAWIWVPTRTAAKRLGVSRQRVHALAKRGRLIACSMDGTTMILADSIERLIESREVVGVRKERGS